MLNSAQAFFGGCLCFITNRHVFHIFNNLSWECVDCTRVLYTLKEVGVENIKDVTVIEYPKRGFAIFEFETY